MDQVCRTCKISSSSLVDIEPNLADMLNNCLTWQISQNDALPQQICQSCIQAAQNAFRLKRRFSPLEEPLEPMEPLCRVCKCVSIALVNIHAKRKLPKRNPSLAKMLTECVGYQPNPSELICQSCTLDVQKAFQFKRQSEKSHFQLLGAHDIKTEIQEEGEGDEYVLPDMDPIPIDNIKLEQATNGEVKVEKEEETEEAPIRYGLELQKFEAFEEFEGVSSSFLDDSEMDSSDNPESQTEGDPNQISNKTTQIERCETCGMTFSRRGYLNVHKRQHSGERPFKCQECPKAFVSSGSLQRHMYTHTDERPFKCTQCPKAFYQSDRLTLHNRIHAEEKPYKCPHCPKSFARMGRLRNHVELHNIDNPHQCPLCPEFFTRRNHLKIHLAAHGGQHLYQCPECLKDFSSSSNLKTHMRTHTGERPYKCSHCSKTYSTIVCLKNHERGHTGERPYKCDQCPKSYTSSGSLLKHVKAHNMERPFQCPQCPKRFPSTECVQKHVKIHSKARPFKCSSCPSAFTRQTTLNKHNIVHTLQKPETQTEEAKKL